MCVTYHLVCVSPECPVTLYLQNHIMLCNCCIMITIVVFVVIIVTITGILQVTSKCAGCCAAAL